MSTISFNKNLPAETSKAIGSLEQHFITLLEQMVYFQLELDRHNGKAAVSLKDKLTDNIDFFSKASSRLLYFADTVLHFVKAVVEVDELVCSAFNLQSRAEYTYTYSPSRIEEEIKLTPTALKEATDTFEGTLQTLEEVLNEFELMLDQVIFDTQFPWDQVDEIWPHAKIEISYIILNAQQRLRELMDNAHSLIEELLRVDHLISNQIN